MTTVNNLDALALMSPPYPTLPHPIPPHPQVSSAPASVQLLTIMQALLLVGPERGDVWLALEALADRATLLAQDSEYMEMMDEWMNE